MMRIPTQRPPSYAVPKPNSSLQSKKWSFSFKYWEQRDFFGLQTSKVGVPWFVGFLSRLKELSRFGIEEVTLDSQRSKAWRFHSIDWNAKNIPITKEEFERMLPEGTLSQETEVCQFMVSKATGRIVGFFDHENVFQIVLLDPNHNIQPSKHFNYAVNPTRFALTEVEVHNKKMTALKASIDSHCATSECSIKNKANEILNTHPQNRFFCLNEVCSQEDIETLVTKYGSIDGVLVEALASLLEAARARHQPD